MKKPVMEAVGTVNTDSIAPPAITRLGAPRIIPAPRPDIIPLKYPYGIGKPQIKNYGVNDGLPQNLITSLEIDREGKVWAGGLGFLSSFDGTRFTNYTKANGLGSGFVNKFLFDHHNQIWILNFDGLYRYDQKAFIPTSLSDKSFSLELRDLCEDHEGNIWVAGGKSIFRIAGDSLAVFNESHGLPSARYWSIHTDRSGNVLVSTSEGVFEFIGNVFTPYTGVRTRDGMAPYIIGKDRQHNLWFTRRHKHDKEIDLIRYNGIDSIIYSGKQGLHLTSSANAILEAHDGTIWIAAGMGGLVRFDGRQFIQYTKRDGLGGNAVWSLAEDPTGNIWVSTDNGISQLSYTYMNNLAEIIPRENGGNNLFTIAPDGSFWVLESVFDSTLLIHYRQTDAVVYSLAALHVTTSFQSITADRNNTIWLTVWEPDKPGKVIRFDGQSFHVYGGPQGITISGFRHPVEDKEGRLWINGSGGALKIQGDTIVHYGKAQGFPEESTRHFIDSRGRHWLGTADTSVYMFDGRYTTRYSRRDGYAGTYVNDITEDPLGNIWFATDEGASRFDGKYFHAYGLVAGMDNLVASIAADTARNLLWFSSLSGLSAVNMDSLDASALATRRYNQQTGFDVITSHLQYNRTHFNTLGIWGASYNGIYRFDYDKVRGFEEPPLRLIQVRIQNQPVIWSQLPDTRRDFRDSLMILNETVLKYGRPPDEEIQQAQARVRGISFDSLGREGFVPQNLRLPFRNNSITFEFAAVSPSFGKYTQYRHKLEGYEDQWSPYSKKNEAFYGNMNEGQYTFRLQAISANGTRSELSYGFRVLPPSHRTWWAYLTYLFLFVSGIYVFIRWRTKTLQRDKIRLEHKVNVRTNELKESLENLRTTQSQLILSEKMASLGELTAGIAHEIQNPLNFVRNFSEVNKELIQDLKSEIERGNPAEIMVIAHDIEANEEKILHHSKRADAIVKGMLAHSRTSTGQAEPTDLNALADEYLRLAYHGLRARDKSFNANFSTQLDPNLPKINLVPQDIGRVILNLVNNAFQAVAEKKKTAEPGYAPTVTVSTGLEDGYAIIRVKDNGPGIPASIKDKIFQPFFTTKPTGQGTGLGLSLSYDIVKAHGGTLRMETTEGTGTTFIIELPATAS